MKVVDFTVMARELRPSGGGTLFKTEKGRVTKSLLKGIDLPPEIIYRCKLTIVRDEFNFELINEVTTYLNALKTLVRETLAGKRNDARIDIPDYDVDFFVRKLRLGRFEVGVIHGETIISAVSVSGGILKKSIDGLPINVP